MPDNSRELTVNTELVTQELFCCDPVEARSRILALEASVQEEIRSGRLKEVEDLSLKHTFIPGVYAREGVIPAGTLIIGKIHRGPCLNFVMAGKITVLTQDGVRTIVAPAFFRSEGGTKRVGVAHTDTVWINVHGTNETDLAKIEAEVIAPDFAAVDQLDLPLVSKEAV